MVFSSDVWGERCGGSVQADERQHGHHDHDEADEIDDRIHDKALGVE
jgi:hypothetical protein